MYMKRFFKIFMGLIAGVLLSFATSSCSKDEMNKNSIEGKWQSTSAIFKEYEAGKLVNEETEKCIDWYIGLNFKSDGTGQVIRYDGGESDTYHMTWMKMGKRLMIVEYYGDGPEESTFDIVEIKRNSLVLSLTEEYTSSGVQCKDISICNFKKIK